MKITKVLVAFLIICLLFTVFVACDNGDGSHQTSNGEQTQPSETLNTLTKFEQFEKGLSEKNIQFEVNQKAAAMVGAKEGYGYNFSDGTAVEVYIFDTSTDAYKDAYKNNKLILESFGITMDVIFNGDICIYFKGDPAEKAIITDTFNNIK